MTQTNLTNAYQDAIQIAKTHYENFPVISFFIPKKLHKHIAVIYQFARQADDIADEGNDEEKVRLEKLNDYEKELTNCLEDKPSNNFWAAVKNTISEKKLSVDNFYNLLKAFKQDVTKKRYSSIPEVLDYCKNSANPVGRLILELFDIRSEKCNYYSDKICTALQLTNFLQDTSIDFEKGRIYLSADDMQKFGVSEKSLELKENNEEIRSLFKLQIKRIDEYFEEGKNLLQHLPYKLRMEISWTISGGEAILRKIERNNYDVLNVRPKLSKFDYIALMLKSFLN
jgi:squalene synthase HpnC